MKAFWRGFKLGFLEVWCGWLNPSFTQVCKDCGLFACEGRDVNCKCDWCREND